MPFNRVQRRLTAWLATLVMVLATLAPTLAQAVVALTDRSDWVQVCSASGMFWIKADGSGLDGPSSAAEGSPMADMGMQCPWCQLHSPAAGWPPACVPLWASVCRAEPLDWAMASAQLPGVWPAASARAPPQAA